MALYGIALVLKFLGVMTYAGGLVGAFVASDEAERKRAVHNVASPALLLTWVAGYTLVWLQGVPMLELWILGGLGLSLVSQFGLVHSVSRRERTAAAFARSAVPVLLVVILMVFRPTWSLFTR